MKVKLKTRSPTDWDGKECTDRADKRREGEAEGEREERSKKRNEEKTQILFAME